MSESTLCTEWDPLSLIFEDEAELSRTAMIVLNCPILLKPHIVCSLWNKVCYRITVDGGTNRWFNFLEEKVNEECVRNKFPQLVTGDMDSVKPELLNQCQKENVTIVNTPLQSKTDFMKSLEYFAKSPRSNLVDTLVILAEHSGRIDQSLGNIHTLFKAQHFFKSKVKMYILASDTVTWLLEPGVHRIHVADRLIESHAYCALIPLGTPCRHVTTSGLKWNLNDSHLEFGEFISTSNTYSGSPVVTIETDNNILWSMSLGLENS